MIQIYADGVLTYDSRLEDYDLQGLLVTTGLNKGGTAEITMPPGHPAYDKYLGYRTIVDVYRDGVRKFRGRALYPIDNFDNQRTVVCEGEMCFFQDAITQPGTYQGTPAVLFADLVSRYNDQVDEFKRFRIGDDLRTIEGGTTLEVDKAESVLTTLNRLLELYGGYITFTDYETGGRAVSWVDSVGRYSDQAVELGENLLDFTRSGANTDLATVLYPYGATNSDTGQQVTIESVNGGVDYIVDETEAAVRGRIAKTVTWDDVTDPSDLLTKARQYLDDAKKYVASLELTALDLSLVDASADTYEVGDYVRVRSAAHRVDDYFQLVDKYENLLDPAGSIIRLGKEIRTLTSQDVAGDGKAQSELKSIAALQTRSIAALEQRSEAQGQSITAQGQSITSQGQSITALTQRTFALEQLTVAQAQSIEALEQLTETQAQSITALEQSIAALTARIEALEAHH